MILSSLAVVALLIYTDISISAVAQDQDYLFTSPGQNQYYPQNPTSFVNPSAGIQFPQSPTSFQSFPPLGGFYSRDLETSELPRNLQETLPQYRQNLNPTGFGNRIVNSPLGFRPTNNYIQPSTHRPNYSHLFSRAHLRNPSQPETFLGEVHIDDPLETPPQYTNDVKALKTEDGNTFGRNGIRNDIFKTRTRFLAPERGGKKLTQVKNYVVGNNGEAFSESSSSAPYNLRSRQTANPSGAPDRINSYSSTEQAISFNSRPEKQLYVPKNAKSNEQKNSLDLESLLEEPIDNNNEHSNKDNVEVVKSTKKELNESEYEDETEEPQEYEEYEEEEEDNDTQKNNMTNNGVDTNNFEGDEYENDTQNEDVRINDRRNRLEIPVTEDASYEAVTVQTTPKTAVTTSDVVTQIPMIVSMATSVNVKKQYFDDNLAQENTKKEPEVVVSVVTSKTVVNNTVLGVITEKPLVTEPVRTTEIINPDNTTDSWVVVASVQTSRSISGARYLPKGIIQDERHTLLNEHDELTPTSAPEKGVDYEVSTEMDTTVQMSSEAPLTEVETSTKARTSTESLLEKLERVESDVASGLLTGGFKTDNIAVINAASGMHDKEMTEITTSSTPSTTKDPYPQVKIRKYSPVQRISTTPRPGSRERFKKLQTSSTTSTTMNVDLDRPQGDQPINGKPNIVVKEDISALLPPGYKPEKIEKPDTNSLLSELLSKAKIQDSNQVDNNNKENETLKQSIPETKTESTFKTTQDDVSKFLPPGYNEQKATTRKPVTVLDDVSKFLPSGYKPSKTTSKPPVTVLEDVSKLLPPGYKAPKNQKESKTDSPLRVTKDDVDVTKLLPPGFKLPRTTNKPPPTVLDDVSKFLPSGYKQRKYEKGGYKTTGAPRTTTEETKEVEDLFKNAQPVDISSLLPPGFNATSKSNSSSSDTILSNLLPPGYNLDNGNKTTNLTETTTVKSTANEKKQIKLVFPGQKSRKTPRLTTPKSSDEIEVKPSVPTIHKGWPSRATTEFTGWPTPSTTPISIEKLLEAARSASASSSTIDTLTDVTSTTTTTTTTTTTPRPTTPGICKEQCDLVGTIKILDNEKWKWKPEYLDRNTQEYQDLANAVEDQLNEVYQSSPVLKKWYKNIRVDGFSEGSILVDYLVELNEVGRQISTIDLKRLFHEALTIQEDMFDSASKQNASREGKALNETVTKEGKLTLGQFDVDPKYTDFIVIPKSIYPTVGYAEDNVLLPQWAIAVIVIGLASLLFVIIFGVTVLANRQKNSKKKTTPLTEDMLNELNKNHMGGYDNYGADDLYNMEDVWNERAYDQKPKKRSNGSINENSTTNLYDSWRSDWNGYYYNNYYGNPSSQHSGYSGRRRSDYDTNF